MNHVNRLQIHSGWTPSYRLVSRKPAPQEPDFKIHQTTGKSGWIILSYDTEIPVCLWVDTESNIEQLSVCLDERLFGDTIFRVERLKDKFVVADVFVYNSTCVFMMSSFRQRYEWLQQILTKFQKLGCTRLYHKSEVLTNIKGYEIYDASKATRGCFVEQENRETILRTEIPDVYTVKGKEGYVLVPNLKTSIFLRSKGSEFQLKCTQKDGNWVVQEDLT
jgi:hypothetical protein